jgi:tungstate transport system substrate-binding protein
MHNDFILVGPPGDPAKTREAMTVQDAFKRIAETGSLFISRGDNSGTNAKELAIWKTVGINPGGRKWYQPTGLGMGQTLNVSAEKKGYTLTDRATYLAFKKTLGLEILQEGDPILLNIYHVIELNSARSPKINVAGGRAFSDFLVAKKTQEVIARFGVAKYGSPLFFPDAGKKDLW